MSTFVKLLALCFFLGVPAAIINFFLPEENEGLAMVIAGLGVLSYFYFLSIIRKNSSGDLAKEQDLEDIKDQEIFRNVGSGPETEVKPHPFTGDYIRDSHTSTNESLGFLKNPTENKEDES